MESAIPVEVVENRIFIIREYKVMLDMHLAGLYGVSTRALNQAVKRNPDRFPADFMFQLTKGELERLNRSQFVTGYQKHRDPRYPPYAFTEQGVAMLSSVLKSKRAARVNIIIMRTFVKLREIMTTHIELARKIEDLEQKYGQHDKHIHTIFKIIKELLKAPPERSPEEKGSPMGFRVE